MITRRSALFGSVSAAAALSAGRPARAQASPVRIGILEDMTGVFSELGGPSTVVAATMAVQDFGGTVLGRPIEIVGGDHRNQPDLGLSIAREWYDVKGVAMISGLTNSAVALGVQKLAAEKNRIDIVQNAATDALIEQYCSRTGIVWNWIASAIVRLTVEQTMKSGKRSWYMIVSDYAGGKIMESEAAPDIAALGGKVLGSGHPALGQTDFASDLLTAQGSGAQVLGVVTFGQDFVNLFKQAVEFGVSGSMQLVAPFVFQSDLRAVGPAAIQNMPVAAPFYWDLNDATRAWSKRFRAQTGRAPDVGHAGTYNALMHYFKSLAAAHTDETEAVLAAMRQIPINDMSTTDGTIRADGMVERQIYLFVGKTPAESTDAWDLLKFVATIPKNEAFPPPVGSKCVLSKS